MVGKGQGGAGCWSSSRSKANRRAERAGALVVRPSLLSERLTDCFAPLSRCSTRDPPLPITPYPVNSNLPLILLRHPRPPPPNRPPPTFPDPSFLRHSSVSRVRLVLPTPNLWKGFPTVPSLRPPGRSDPKVRHGHLPTVLQGEGCRHRFREGSSASLLSLLLPSRSCGKGIPCANQLLADHLRLSR